MSSKPGDGVFAPIRVTNLRGDQPIEFNAYIKINDRYILYLRQGDSFEGSRLQRLREKKLKQMYIDLTEERKFQSYVSQNQALAFDPLSGKSLEMRCEIIQGIQQSSAEAFFEKPESSEHYGKTKSDCERFVSFLSTEAEAAGLILRIANLDQSIPHHCVTVSTLATALALHINKIDAKQLQILSLGALLHDFEHFRSGLDLSRSRSSLTSGELEIYKNHPLEGARHIQTLRHIDAQVIKIISQHEEYIDGGGFPLGLKGNELEPLSVYVSAANALDRMMVFEGVPRSDVGNRFLRENLGRYPLEYLNTLVKLIR